MARPKLPDEEFRSVPIQFRVTESEAVELEELDPTKSASINAYKIVKEELGE